MLQASKFKIPNSAQKGFTLLEILLVIALIAILAGIIVVAMNPAKQLTSARNLQRQADINTYINAIYQYTIDGNSLASLIPGTTDSCKTTCTGTTAYTNTALQICKVGIAGTGCTNSALGSISTLLVNYLPTMPADPSLTTLDSGGTGYYVCEDTTTKNVTVCAPGTETGYGATIYSVTK